MANDSLKFQIKALESLMVGESPDETDLEETSHEEERGQNGEEMNDAGVEQGSDDNYDVDHDNIMKVTFLQYFT